MLLRVDNVNERSAVLDLESLIVFDAVVAREVHHVELNVLVVGHRLTLHRDRRQQEERLVRGHFLEHHFGDGRFARPARVSAMETYLGMPIR